MKPFKQSDPLCHSEQNKRQSHDLLSQVRPGIQPPFAAALSTLSFAQLPIDPQLHVRARGAAENRKEVSGIRREPGQRTVKSDEDLYPRSEETDETRGLRDFEKIVSGRKASKKHKSKWRDHLRGRLDWTGRARAEANPQICFKMWSVMWRHFFTDWPEVITFVTNGEKSV